MHLLPALGFGSAGLDLGIHKPLRHQPHECISARVLNAFAPCTRAWECGARFGHSQTASSPTSRMHFSTGSKCICARALGFGSVGPCRGCLHGDLGSHEPLCHQLRECISAQILNAFGPAHSGLGAWGHVALFHGDLSTHTQTASSPTSRMHFGINSKCICSLYSGLGVRG